MRRILYTTCLFLCCVLPAGKLFAGGNDSLPSIQLKALPESSIGAYWHNDFFFKTDYYYSNGLGVEWSSPLLKPGFIDRFTPSKREIEMSEYSLLMAQGIYTPLHTGTTRIDRTDRPYAGTLTATWKRNSYSYSTCYSSSITIGTIGKYSAGEQTQNGIHQAIDNDLALGWYAQVNTDLLINWDGNRQYRLWESEYIDFTGGYGYGIGTLQTYLAADLSVRIGHRKYVFGNSGLPYERATSNTWYYYWYSSLKLRGVLHNATLHGGLFSPAGQVHEIGYYESRQFVPELHTGLVVGYRNFSINLTATHLRPEFRTGLPHTWGGVRLRFYF